MARVQILKVLRWVVLPYLTKVPWYSGQSSPSEVALPILAWGGGHGLPRVLEPDNMGLEGSL